jgi:Radical SAM superfamily
MRLGIVLTARCNASCVHCSKSYGPYRTEQLGLDAIHRLMDQAAKIEDDVPLSFELTGGEPFVDFERLVSVVGHGARLGGTVTCVTNGFWARNDAEARTKLTTLRDAGLTLLAVSVSRFHQEFVPLQRVGRALAMAGELGIRTTLKGAVVKSDLVPGGALDTWKDVLDADRITIFPVLPYLRDDQVLPEEEYYRERGLPMHRCPGDAVCVDFDGVARSCCTMRADDDFLVIGDARREPLEEIYATFRNAGKQRILRESGPIEFARGAIAAGLGHHLKKAYAGPCDLCLHIQAEPQLRQVAEAMSKEAAQSAIEK